MPRFNPFQGTADMMPSGSNLAGPGLGMVEPNASGAMPNPAPTQGMITGYRATKTQVKLRRHSTKRAAPNTKTKRLSVTQANTQIKAPAKQVARRVRGKQNIPSVLVPGVTEIPL